MPAINATGVWTEVNYGQKTIFASAQSEELFMSRQDIDILRHLAEKVSKLSQSSENITKKDLWYEHNSLKTKKPLIFCDPENGWNEIILSDDLNCRSPLARRWEIILLKEIFYGEKLKDDKPIEIYFDIGYTYKETDWISSRSIRGGLDGGSYVWDGKIKSIEDIEMINYPTIDIDYKTTLENLNIASNVFKDLLIPRIKGQWWWSLGLTIDLVGLIGLENMFFQLIDNGEFIKKVLEKLRDGWIKKINFLQNSKLLSNNNDDSYVGSGGLGYCKELDNSEDSIITTKNLWGFAESQETGQVSPEMFKEFVFPFQLELLKLFGLNCYGCCEPLDKRWHVIKQIPNLRRVSVSNWADYRKMSEYLEDKYIFSYKPSPTDLAVSSINKDYIRKNIRNFLEVTKGNIVEIIMKDNHTIGKNPQNVVDWVKIVREEINKLYE